MKKFFGSCVFILLMIVLYSFFVYKQRIPEFKVIDLRNNIISAEDLTDNVVLINFWFPSCSGCVQEMPKLNSVYEKYKHNKFRLIGISANYNSMSQVIEYIKFRKINFDIIYDTYNTILNKFEVKMFPSTFLINKSGYIDTAYVAGEPDWEKLEKRINYLLNK